MSAARKQHDGDVPCVFLALGVLTGGKHTQLKRLLYGGAGCVNHVVRCIG